MSRFAFVLPVAALLVVFGCSGTSTEQAIVEKPDETRFTPVVLAEGEALDEPMAFEVLSDERVLFVERKGGVKMYDPETDSTYLIATIPVNIMYTNAEGESRNAEEGLVGVTVDPEFDENGWVYMLHADPDESKHILSRWTLDGRTLLDESRVDLLEYPVQRQQCCHTGGGMTWDADGNLYMTIGNNTSNDQGSQTDERPGREPWDDQRGSANTNDLRGKIIRIHPEEDGSYTIPEGNLFPEGTANTRPEIYTMGHRNAWRVSIDSETGCIYWGEVGPDAREDTEVGPRGYDELNQACEPGYFGWPYFVGENHAFPFHDFVEDTLLAPKDPNNVTNTSVNNTGLQQLPPAQPAFISYPYGYSERFPDVGSGGRSATGGPIYHQAGFDDAERPFPAYYEGKWIAADLSRGWIMAITIGDDNEYVSMERFLSSYRPVEPIDIKFGPTGDLYVLEYGETWFADSQDDKLVRIEYNGGNRAPIAEASTSARGGAVPFDVTLSAEGSMDHDGDALTYTWEVAPSRGGDVRSFEGASPTVPFEENGVYVATLTATDPSGASNSSAVRIVAGNAAPEVSVQYEGNRTFFFPGVAIPYDVRVTDAEDGALGEGITDDRVAVSIDYVSQAVQEGTLSGDGESAGRFAVAQMLMSQSDCAVCHQVDQTSNGPAFTDIAERYAGEASAADMLAEKVIQGGSGNWEAETVMPAHPALTMNDARTMVQYILNVNDETAGSLPPSGTYTPIIPEDDYGRGSLIIRAAYTDRGGAMMPSQRTEEIIVLRSPVLDLGSASDVEGAEMAPSGRGGGPMTIAPRPNAHAVYRNIDLSGIGSLVVDASAGSRSGEAGGTIEIRLDSPTGTLLGEIDVPAPDPNQRGFGGFGGGDDAGDVLELPATDGLHDVVLVFRNDEAHAAQQLMTLSRVEFIHGGGMGMASAN